MTHDHDKELCPLSSFRRGSRLYLLIGCMINQKIYPFRHYSGHFIGSEFRRVRCVPGNSIREEVVNDIKNL